MLVGLQRWVDEIYVTRLGFAIFISLLISGNDCNRKKRIPLRKLIVSQSEYEHCKINPAAKNGERKFRPIAE